VEHILLDNQFKLNLKITTLTILPIEMEYLNVRSNSENKTIENDNIVVITGTITTSKYLGNNVPFTFNISYLDEDNNKYHQRVIGKGLNIKIDPPVLQE
jgi:hypothetical protein